MQWLQQVGSVLAKNELELDMEQVLKNLKES